MTTATAVRQGKTSTWSSMFPNEQITEQQSSLFVKKLLAIAVSNITYLRAMFPEQAFGDRSLEELNVKILRDDSSCPGACQVIQWMKACFDALEKKYLERLIIGIYTNPNDLNSIIESYTFKFSYMQDGIDIYRNGNKISGAVTATETRKATLQLLRTIIVLNQTLKPLPDDVWLTVKLYYHDEITPPDYEPPGFKPGNADSFQFEKEPLNIKLGNVPTPFHMIKLRIKTDKSQFEESNQTNSDKDKKENTEKLKDLSCEEDTSLTELEDKVSIPDKEPDLPTSSKTILDKTSKKCTEDKNIVCCPCGCNEDDGLMILCATCNYWQHAVCFCILDNDEAPSTHYCASCSKLIGKPCTDSSLVEISLSDQQSICLWRRVLLVCLEEKKFTVQGLAKKLGVENTVAQGFFNRLKMEGFIKAPSGKVKRFRHNIVNVENLQSVGIPQYFKGMNPEIPEQNASCEKMERCSSDSKSAEMQVNELTKQANSLSLSNRVNINSEMLNNGNNAISPRVNSDRASRSRKRSIIPTASPSFEDLEVSCSQEEVSKKRQKISLASKSILV